MKETVQRITEELTKHPKSLVATGLVGAAALIGCGDSKPRQSTATNNIEIVEPAPEYTESAPQGPQVKFPADIPAHRDLRPQTMPNEEVCKDFWVDVDEQRRPLIQRDPVVVTVDGRCNTPLNDPRVGVYPNPVQESGQSTFVATNGDALVVECYTTGQVIQDLRGPSSASDVWLYVANKEGESGLIPETNVGFVAEKQILEEC